MIDLSVSLEAGPIGSLVGDPIPELGGGFKSSTYCLSGPVLFLFSRLLFVVCVEKSAAFLLDLPVNRPQPVSRFTPCLLIRFLVNLVAFTLWLVIGLTLACFTLLLLHGF